MPDRNQSDAVSVLAVSHQSEMWGNERQLLGLVPELASRGVRVTLAAPRHGAFLRAWRDAGLEAFGLDLPPHGGIRGSGGAGRPGPVGLAREAVAVGWSAVRVARLARRYDALLSVSLTAHVETAIAGRLARRPAALMVVDIVAPGMGRRLLQLAARWADLTIVNSSATAATLEGRGRVELLHPGVDAGAFTPKPPDDGVRASLGASADDLLVGIVGRLDEEKGVHVLIEALHGLDVPGRTVRLAVVGDTGTGPEDYARMLRMQAQPLGNRVCFAGRRSDVPDVLRALDVLVNASRAEPFGLSVLEAQACGVPVVGTEAGGIPDFVEDGVTGLLVPPGDAAVLRQALERVLADAALRRTLAEAALRQARERFAIELQFDRCAALFGGLRPGSVVA